MDIIIYDDETLRKDEVIGECQVRLFRHAFQMKRACQAGLCGSHGHLARLLFAAYCLELGATMHACILTVASIMANAICACEAFVQSCVTWQAAQAAQQPEPLPELPLPVAVQWVAACMYVYFRTMHTALLLPPHDIVSKSSTCQGCCCQLSNALCKKFMLCVPALCVGILCKCT